MNTFRFEWDPDKAIANLDKHGVSFEEAMTVFYDESAVEFYDDKHLEWEDRFLLLGLSSRFNLLMVCHCHRADDEVIRLISARRATKSAPSSSHYWTTVVPRTGLTLPMGCLRYAPARLRQAGYGLCLQQAFR